MFFVFRKKNYVQFRYENLPKMRLKTVKCTNDVNYTDALLRTALQKK